MDYIVTFGFSTLISLLTLWHENGKDMSYEELVSLFHTLVSIGVLGLTKKKLFEEQL